jgi:hypothetical protein
MKSNKIVCKRLFYQYIPAKLSLESCFIAGNASLIPHGFIKQFQSEIQQFRSEIQHFPYSALRPLCYACLATGKSEIEYLTHFLFYVLARSFIEMYNAFYGDFK